MTTKIRITLHSDDSRIGIITINDDLTDEEIAAIANESGGMADLVAMGDWDGPDDYEWTGDEEYEVIDLVEVLGRIIQYDQSGVGHCWKPAGEVDCPPSIQEEIDAEIIDGKQSKCESFRASNGVFYRW